MKKTTFYIGHFMALFLLNEAYGAPNIKICLTGTTVKAFPKYGQAFYNAAELAKERFISQNPNWNVDLQRYYYDRTPFGALEATKNMVSGDCHAAIGYSTGNDLLIASEYLEKNPMFVMSLYGDPHPKLKKTPFVATMCPEQSFVVGGLLDRLEDRIPRNKPFLIVTAVDRTGMTTYKSTFMEQLEERGIPFLNVDALEKTGNIDNFTVFYDQHKSRVGGVVILTRSLLAAKITDYITSKTDKNSRPLLIGTTYFGSSALPAYLNYLTNKDVQAYIPKQNCLCDDDPAYRDFVSQYKQRYGMDPMVISGYAFDAVNMILDATKRNLANEGALNRETVVHIMQKVEFSGITGTRVNPGLQVTPTKLFIIEVSDKGYRKI